MPMGNSSQTSAVRQEEILKTPTFSGFLALFSGYNHRQSPTIAVPLSAINCPIDTHLT